MDIQNKVLENFKTLFPAVEDSIANVLYDYALEDVLDFTRMVSTEIDKRFLGILQDLMAYRLNQLGIEGIKSESNAGVGTTYTEDIPERIKSKLRKYRRLP